MSGLLYCEAHKEAFTTKCGPCLALQVRELTEKLEAEDAAHSQTISDRDLFEEALTRLASEAGCTEEWSNLHSHGECVTNFWAARVEVLRGVIREMISTVENGRLCSIGSIDNTYEPQIGRGTVNRWKQYIEKQ